MSNQKPILFSTPMVEAILEGRKTMTRRILKVKGCKPFIPDRSWDINTILKWNNDYHPYGKVRDVLWVRETWCLKTPFGPEEYYFGYKAFDTCVNIKASEKYDYKSPDVYYPSIHMPKEACRIFLQITNIRVERLQDINEQDAISEGIERIADYGTTGYKLYTKPDAAFSDIDAKYSFESLWESINGMESWNLNPWVWVIEFERIEKPKDWVI